MPRRPHQKNLTEAQKKRIRQIYARREADQKSLAERFGVSPGYISQIIVEGRKK